MIDINSNDIGILIDQKHHKDLVVSECKTGSSGRGNNIFDVFVMRKSWSNFSTIGYEIKITRQDFLNDNKWQNYLPYCNEFYFVTPWGMINKNEIPENVGLYWVSKNSNRLFNKKKASYREITNDDLISVFIYLLMWRMNIAKYQEIDNVKFWKNWLKEKKINWELGQMVSKELNIKIENRIDEVEKENNKLRSENEKLSELKKIAKKLGFDLYGYFYSNGAERKIKELQNKIPRDLMINIDNIITNLNKLKSNLDGIKCP